MRAVILLALLITTHQPTLAEWSEAEVQDFRKECLEGCAQNPNVKAKTQCTAYCQCFMDQAATAFPDYAKGSKDIDDKVPDAVTKMSTIAKSCNARAFRR